jgi:hypothetical protein
MAGFFVRSVRWKSLNHNKATVQRTDSDVRAPPYCGLRKALVLFGDDLQTIALKLERDMYVHGSLIAGLFRVMLRESRSNGCAGAEFYC